MPTYEYVCEECKKPFEMKATVAEYSAGLEARCPSCDSSRVLRTFAGIAVAGSSRRGSSGGPLCGPGAGPGCCG